MINTNYERLRTNDDLQKPCKSSNGNVPRQFATKLDTVSFSGKYHSSSEQKMKTYAIKLLREIGLKPNQSLHITTDSKYMPFVRILTEKAYKKGSGEVKIEKVEPEIEALKKRYGITEEFDYKKAQRKEFEDEGAIFLNFDEKNNPYKKAGLSRSQRESQAARITDKIPTKIAKHLQFDKEELFYTGLDMHKGEPIQIVGEREHLPQIVQMADFLYSKNKTRLIDISLKEKKEFDPQVAFYKYAKDDLIEKTRPSEIAEEKEIDQKDVAFLLLRGPDPTQYAECNADRVNRNSTAKSEYTEELHSKNIEYHPWLIVWTPTLSTVKSDYRDFGKDKMAGLKQALKDATIIDRIGHLKEHLDFLETAAQKVNAVVEKGYRVLHYVSHDKATQQPDGKTDLRVGLSPKSFFVAARLNMPSGHSVACNIPTEELFTSPQAHPSVEDIKAGKSSILASGKVSATMPLALLGKIIDKIKIRFDGTAKEVSATKNGKFLQDYVAKNKGANSLGEAALVFQSPIARIKTRYGEQRIFRNTLPAENAACHIALGNAYPDPIKGSMEIADYAEQQKYLKDLGINSSPVHTDFMIGGPNVQVSLENPNTGKSVTVIKDDQLQL